MAIMDFLNRQFIDVIEWVDDSRDTLSFRFPDDDKQIKNEAQLIVRESQVAQFVYVGQFADTLGPGKHTLKTENIPILGDLLGWKYKFQTPFKADVYYVTTRVFAGNKWGTANPVMMRDADFGVRITLFDECVCTAVCLGEIVHDFQEHLLTIFFFRRPAPDQK